MLRTRSHVGRSATARGGPLARCFARMIILGLGLGSATAGAAPAVGSIPTAIIAGPDAEHLKQRILLDRRLVPTQNLEQARLFWVLGTEGESEGKGEGAGLTAAQWQQILQRVRGGAGLVLVPGAQPPDLGPLGLVRGQPHQGHVSLEVPKPHRATYPFLAHQVVWPTAPQLTQRWTVSVRAGADLSAVVLEKDSTRPVLLTGRLGRGRVSVLTARLVHPKNEQLVLWPYFPYLLHVLSSRAAGVAPDSFARWPAAPVPGSKTIWIMGCCIAVAWLLTLALFFKVRRYSKAHPELLDNFFKEALRRQATSATEEERPSWRSIGFTRSLAGFLTLAGTLFVVFAPWYYLTNVLIPNHVQPFPQAKGMFGFSWEILNVAWFLFDAGTYVAFVKYFAEYRIKDPSEAVRSAQFFCWWQILTGLVQVTFVGIVAVTILPHTAWGYSSTFWILIAVSQYPGVFGIMNFFFQAYQRYDLNIGLDLLSDWLLRFALQIPCVLIFRAWGRANPEYGEAFGAAVGIGMGFYISTAVTFGVGTVLYKRLGLKLTPLFLAHFDRKTAWRMLKFGLKVVTGKVFFRAAKMIDRVVIAALLVNYTEWLGLEDQIHYNLLFIFPIAYRFFETATAAISESHGNDKPVLTQYYLVRFFQVGTLYTAIMVSLFLALGPTFVHHAMDAQWARAADYMLIATLVGAFSAAAWLSDMLQKGTGRPGLFALVLGVEQVLRIGLFLLLIPAFQFQGYYWALLSTIGLKVAGAWILNHLLIIRVRLFPWQMFAAPALAGALNYGLLRLIDAGLGLSGRTEVVVFFFAAALLSFFVCFFFMGLAGGADRAFATELEQASKMTGALRPLTRLFYLAARAGWTLSPLHDRFPVTIQARAMEQAADLDRQRREVDGG
jgi:O-antigen/teichoic acid export membrane protein